jgi:hypothetical protein
MEENEQIFLMQEKKIEKMIILLERNFFSLNNMFFHILFIKERDRKSE